MLLATWSGAQEHPAATENRAQIGQAVRQAFEQCGKKEWLGSVAVPLGSADSEAAGLEVRLGCASYLRWWDGAYLLSPFTIVDKNGAMRRSIPAAEWQSYLDDLPGIVG
jgi:hypothetical protein